MNPPGDRLRLIRVLAGITLTVLFMQFLLGMWLNLFASFPTVSFQSGSMMSSMMGFMFSGGMFELMGHMMIGFLLLALSIIALGVSLSLGKIGISLLGLAGFGSILLAGISGLGFMFSGFQNNTYSYLMAVSFIFAFAVYFAELLFANNLFTRGDVMR